MCSKRDEGVPCNIDLTSGSKTSLRNIMGYILMLLSSSQLASEAVRAAECRKLPYASSHLPPNIEVQNVGLLMGDAQLNARGSVSTAFATHM